MKILVIPEFSKFGGTLGFFLRILEIHKEQGFSTAVLLDPSQQRPALCERLGLEDVHVFTSPPRSKPAFHPALSGFFDIWIVFRAYRDSRPDFIVVSNGTPGIMLGSLVFPVPVLFIMHTYPGKDQRPFRWLWRLLGHLGRNRFLTVSTYAADCIHRNMGIIPRRIEIVYNSYSWALPEKAVREAEVLTIGHVVGYKNPGIWLQVAQRVLEQNPAARFIWLGEGVLLEEMRQQVDRLGLANNVSFEGYRPDVGNYLARARVYFQPSRIENHALSVLDAMACGLPCVASEIGGMPESVIDGLTGFLCHPEDVEIFAARLLALLGDDSLCVRMGGAGRQRALELFSPENQKQELLRIYARMTGQDANAK